MWGRLRAPRPSRAAGGYGNSGGGLVGSNCAYRLAKSDRPERCDRGGGFVGFGGFLGSGRLTTAASATTTPTTPGTCDLELGSTSNDALLEPDSMQYAAAAAAAAARTTTARYRFRDLLLGDFAFNDDGERYVRVARSACVDRHEIRLEFTHMWRHVCVVFCKSR